MDKEFGCVPAGCAITVQTLTLRLPIAPRSAGSVTVWSIWYSSCSIMYGIQPTPLSTGRRPERIGGFP